MCPQHLLSHKGSYLEYRFESDDVISVLVWHGVFVQVFNQNKNTAEFLTLNCSLCLTAATEGEVLE